MISERTSDVYKRQGEGVYLMKHLKGGVKKGAFDDAEAQKRFDAWKNGKDAKISAVREGDVYKRQEETLHLLIQLGGKSLVVAQDERRLPNVGNHVCHRKGFTRAGYTQQHQMCIRDSSSRSCRILKHNINF